jgi:hypothetical protein
MPTAKHWNNKIKSKMRADKESQEEVIMAKATEDKDNGDVQITEVIEVEKSKKTAASASKKKSAPAMSDADWVQGLDEKEAKWFSKNARSHEDLDSSEIKCTACFRQVNHKQEVSAEPKE